MEMNVRRVGWVVVFAGLAFSAFGLVSLSAWWDLSLRLHESDLQIDYDRVSDIEPLWAFRYARESLTDDVFALPEVALGLSVLLVLIGGIASAAWRRVGRGMMLAGVAIGVVFTVLYVRDWMVIGFVGTRCGPIAMPPTRHDFVDVQVLGAQLGVLGAFTYFFVNRTFPSFVIGVFGAAILAAPLALPPATANVVITLVALGGMTFAAWLQRELPPQSSSSSRSSELLAD